MEWHEGVCDSNIVNKSFVRVRARHRISIEDTNNELMEMTYEHGERATYKYTHNNICIYHSKRKSILWKIEMTLLKKYSQTEYAISSGVCLSTREDWMVCTV